MKIYRNAENLAETHGTFEIELNGEFCDTCDCDILSDTCKHNK